MPDFFPLAASIVNPDDLTPERVATLHSLLDDAARKVGEQRQYIQTLEAQVAAHSAKTMTLVANHAALTDRLRDAMKAVNTELWWCAIQLGCNWKDLKWRENSSVGRAYDRAVAAITPAAIADELVEAGEGAS